jgi:hypothetical protein
MNRRRILIVASVFLMMSIASSASAPWNEIRIRYYSDDSFATQTGIHLIYCNGSEYFFGSSNSWRIWDEYSCWSGNRVVHRCQQTDGMGGWITMNCPF